jgi:hypothetical protein
METSTGGQVKSNDNPDSMEVVRFHINHGNLGIGLVQVEDCELSEDFGSWAIGDRTLVRSFIEEGLSRARASHRVPSWVVKHDNLLQLVKASLDTCMWKAEVSTHGGWCGGPRLGREIKSNPGIVVDNMRAMLV